MDTTPFTKNKDENINKDFTGENPLEKYYPTYEGFQHDFDFTGIGADLL